MELIRIDPEKCNKDGICADECPSQIIKMTGDGGMPVLMEGGERFCIDCGHCLAVCPYGALSHNGLDPEQATPVAENWALDPASVANLMLARRSIRCFRKQPVEKDVLEQLIEICRYAPTGRNIQPVQWNVLVQKNRVKEVADHVIGWMEHMIREMPDMAREWNMQRTVDNFKSGYDSICRDAPHLVAVHAPKEERSAPAACTIALTHLDLAAPAFGLGTCWGGYVYAAAQFWEPARQALEIPEGHGCFGAMMVGRPKYQYHRIPARKPAQVTWF